MESITGFIEGRDGVICEMCRNPFINKYIDRRQNANAQLIVIAPEMYEFINNIKDDDYIRYMYGDKINNLLGEGK